MVGHDQQVALPLAVGNLVDPDPPQPRQPVGLAGPLGDHAGDDARHRAPRDAQQHRHHRQGGVADQPRGGVLERGGGPGSRPRPWHGGDHHPVGRARHPAGRGLQAHLGRAQIQTPPAARFLAQVTARAAPPAARAPRPGPAPGPDRAMSCSPPRPSGSRSTDSTTVCSTPSSRRHTLVVRTPSPS